MSLKLFCKSYAKDFPWLKLALKSVSKLCKEEVEWTIVCDNGEKQGLINFLGNDAPLRIFEVNDHWSDCAQMSVGYLSQQWIKMNSHRVMEDGLYWNWDSDVIAIKPFSSESFLGKSGRPIYWISQFNSIMNGTDRPAHEGRIALLKTIFGLESIPGEYMNAEIPFEYMRSMPVPLYGNLLKQCADRPEWKRSFEVLKSGDHRFSEFNVIGRAFHILFPEAFEWHNAEADGQTWSGGYAEGGEGSGAFQDHAIISQCWSWGGIPKHVTDFVNAL